MKYLGVIVLIVFLISCRASYNIEKYYDEFDGYGVERLNGNFLLDNEWVPANTIEFCPQRFTSKSGELSYQLYIRYLGKDWMFVGEGETLIFLIDGERIGLSGKGSSNYRDVYEDSNEYSIQEILTYNIEKDFLKKLFNANLVKIKLVGKTRSADWEFSKSQLKNIEKFYTEY